MAKIVKKKTSIKFCKSEQIYSTTKKIVQKILVSLQGINNNVKVMPHFFFRNIMSMFNQATINYIIV